MSKHLTIASGWFNDEHEVLYCTAKGEYASIYDTSTKKGEKCPIKLFVQNENGEQLEVTSFRVVANTRRREDKNDPTHEVKVKLED